MRRAGALEGAGPWSMEAQGGKRVSFAPDGWLLLPENGVFGGLGHAELDHPLSRNFDRFPRLWIASHSCLAIGEHKLTDPGHHKDVLRFPICQGGKVVQ